MMNSSPQTSIPSNFHQIDSKVEGITVFAPIPEKSHIHETKTYQCPNCGATTQYDVASSGVACEHCGYLAPQSARQVGRSAAQEEFTLAALALSDQGWGTERTRMLCDNCGAELSIPSKAITHTCPFCTSNRVNLSNFPADILRPKFLIPFKIIPEDTRNLVRSWLQKGWFHPPELASLASLEKFTGIYLPFWTFDANVAASWRAQVGYTRTVRDRDGHTHTVTDWRWESGNVALNVDDFPYLGSDKVSQIILERLLPYQFGELVSYSPDYLAGWQAQQYNIPLPDAWQEAKEVIREKAQAACRAQIHSSQVRNFSMTAEFSNEAWRYVLLPVYLSAYNHEGRVFQVMVNGQTGTVAGQKPVAWWKIWLAIAGMLLPGLGLGLIGLPLLLLGGAGVVPIILGFILLVPGGIFSFLLYQKAVNSERA